MQVKVDTASLNQLTSTLTRELDKFSITITRICGLKATLGSTLEGNVAASFDQVCSKAMACKNAVETSIINTRKEVAKMIEIAENFEKIRF